MDFDHTQTQSDRDQSRSRELSERPTRPPLELPAYETRQFLGAGAYGEVWVAVDKNTGRRVAIKFLTHRTAVDWSLLSGEVEKLIFLSADRYVVQLLEVGWDAEPPYFVMEYVEHGSLEQRLESPTPLSVAEAVELFREIVIGIAHAHRKGVLHCDLKPANVLLDHDQRPRLADFGQSRLSHEQRPSLGTLFYMAPEQADLKSIPDAGWDIYALGALLYRMLTGTPPFRDEKTLSEIGSSVDLDDRLRRYRDHIASSSRPRLHRRIPGVDRALADIVDRCLERDPDARFRDAQAILDALEERERNHHRRPLLVLGLIGPLVLLAVMSLFAWRGYKRAIDNVTTAVAHGVQESSQGTARLAAEVVSHRISRCFRGVEEIAKMDDFRDELTSCLANAEITHLADQLNRTDLPDKEREQFRDDLEKHPARQPLDDYMNQCLHDESLPQASSWFVTDARGLHLASAFDTPPVNSVVGKNFSYRSYFNGIEDFPPSDGALDRDCITRTHLSQVFQSTATGTWKIAVSTPIRNAKQELLGVLALTVELGTFTKFVNTPDQFAVIVDSRPDPRSYGLILQHPLFDEILEKKGQLPPSLCEYHVPLKQMQAQPERYHDPIGDHQLGAAYKRNWIAALEPVQLDARGSEGEEGTRRATGLAVLAQYDYDKATLPVKQLQAELPPLGRWAVVAALLVTSLLWFVVHRLSRATKNASLTRTHTDIPAMHNMETVELPARLR